jgi:hypothetical protein
MTTRVLPGSTRPSAVLGWAAAGLVLLWLGMLLHEAGHALLGTLLYPPYSWQGDVSAWKRGLVIAAGPGVTAGLLLLACVLARRGATRWRILVATSLGLGAASRLIVIAPSVFQGTFRGDELVLARGLGLSVYTLLLPELLLSAGASVWLSRRIPADQRGPALGALLLGIALGWVSLFGLGRRLGIPI